MNFLRNLTTFSQRWPLNMYFLRAYKRAPTSWPLAGLSHNLPTHTTLRSCGASDVGALTFLRFVCCFKPPRSRVGAAPGYVTTLRTGAGAYEVAARPP